VNARKFRIILPIGLVLILVQTGWADSARDLLRQGNKLYASGKFNGAITQYDQALVEKPQVFEPKFNKANSYYRLDDLAEAIDLFKEVAADSKDMGLVTKAKYNLGNSYFQQGLKQRDSDLQKALDDLKTSINYWRQVLDIEPENEKAAKNIEVARLIIKDIIDQINKQKDKQAEQQEQQQDQHQQGQQQQQESGQDPNQPSPQQQQQPEQEQGKDPEEQKKEEKQVQPPDATAQEILDNEQRQKEKRQILQRGGWQKVEKDW